jgi:hypothetical protein
VAIAMTKGTYADCPCLKTRRMRMYLPDSPFAQTRVLMGVQADSGSSTQP